jgi:hypothetical protein
MTTPLISMIRPVFALSVPFSDMALLGEVERGAGGARRARVYLRSLPRGGTYETR